MFIIALRATTPSLAAILFEFLPPYFIAGPLLLASLLLLSLAPVGLLHNSCHIIASLPITALPLCHAAMCFFIIAFRLMPLLYAGAIINRAG